MARASALAVAIAVSLLAVSGAGGASAQAPRNGGTLAFAMVPPEPGCLNVLVARCAPGNSQISLLTVVQRVLASPFEVGPDLTWRPRLVSGVTFTRKPPFTLTYRIRPEARWSDGVPVTARDFVFTHRAKVSLARKGELLPGEAELLDQVRRVTVVDAKTVRVVLRTRLAGWRALFGNVLPEHALRGEDLTKVWIDRIDNPQTGAPIGSGPFVVERWDRGRQLILRRNPRYWGPHPGYLDRLLVRFQVQGGDLVDGFRRRELHVAWGFPPSFFADLRRQPRVRTIARPGPGWDHLAIRLGPGGHPALRSKLVRRALAYGIDRASIVRQVFGELDPSLRPLDSVVYPSHSRFYQPSWGSFQYQPAQARRLLEQAGCRRGADGIYVCGGERLSLRFTSPAIPGGYRPRVLELVQAQLRDVGVEVVPTFAVPSAFFNQILPRGDFHVALFGWVASSPDPAMKPILGCGGQQNYTGYCQRLVTSELDQAELSLGADEQARASNAADAKLARDVPLIPLFQPPVWAALGTSVRGYSPAVTADPLTDAENWWLAPER